MLATLFNMPKWLLAIVAVCILTGHYQQVECKLTGCKSAAVAQAGDNHQDGDSSSQVEGGHCQCQCHFLALSIGHLPTPYVSFIRAVSTSPVPWIEDAPEAPCLDIEHPPQLA